MKRGGREGKRPRGILLHGLKGIDAPDLKHVVPKYPHLRTIAGSRAFVKLLELGVRTPVGPFLAYGTPGYRFSAFLYAKP